jgi:predicted RNase H-like HicB family nuclease
MLRQLTAGADYGIDTFWRDAMSETASHPAESAGFGHLTFVYTPNPDGWVTAQIAEFPAAISQGETKEAARRNVLDALHDLTHEPTPAERIAFSAQARLDEAQAALDAARDELVDLVGVFRRLITAARDRTHDRVH